MIVGNAGASQDTHTPTHTNRTSHARYRHEAENKRLQNDQQGRKYIVGKYIYTSTAFKYNI